jgi:hypothetical protein
MVNKIRNGIVWVRTPKCATTTMAVHLKRFCEWKKIKYTPHDNHGVMAPTHFVNLGHLYSGDVNWDIVLGEGRGIMASIRNPLERFLSHYKHHLRENRYEEFKEDVSAFYLHNYKRINFEQMFLGMNNYMCKYLGVGGDEGWNVDILNKRYDYFSVADKFEQSLNKFEKLTGYKFKEKDLIENKTDNNLIITDEFVEFFKENNKQDYELYNYVLDIYGYK